MKLERIDHLLSRCGYCSRKEAFLLGRQGRILSNGVSIKDVSSRVDPLSVILDDEPLDHPGGILVALHKPVGYVCSHDSGEGPRIYDLIPEQWNYRNPKPISIGRLDKDASGIILITDDTQLVHRLTSPKSNIDKTYEVTVDLPLNSSLVASFSSGTLMLDKEDKPCLPAELTITGEHTSTLVLHEGRYHQVKRMFGAKGFTVTKLHRIRFGEYSVDGIEEGTFSDLSEVLGDGA